MLMYDWLYDQDVNLMRKLAEDSEAPLPLVRGGGGVRGRVCVGRGEGWGGTRWDVGEGKLEDRGSRRVLFSFPQLEPSQLRV